MRLIDADSLQSVKFHALPYTHITPIDADAESYERGWNDAIDAIMIDTPSSQPEQRWIQCSERLPKIGQYILRTVKGFSWNCEEHWTVDIGLYDTNDGSIIAWMPLPAPYKKEIAND